MTRISQNDWQYVIPSLLLLTVFIGTDLLDIFQKSDFAYLSGVIINEPYRLVTAHLFHADFNHLLANTFGIVIVRYFFWQLKLKNTYFFIVLIFLLMPLQVFLQWFIDMPVLKNPFSLLIGFSGILYGADAFILFSSMLGKEKFLNFKLGLVSNIEVFRAMLLLTTLGFLSSLLPGISFSGHLTGFIAGSILFLL